MTVLMNDFVHAFIKISVNACDVIQNKTRL